MVKDVAVYMDFSPGEIGQATRVVKVHVCEHNMAHSIRLNPQPGDLSNCGFFVNERHESDQLEHPQDARFLDVIQRAQAGIHQHQPVVAFNQQAQCASSPMTGDAGVAGKAVEIVDAHFLMIHPISVLTILSFSQKTPGRCEPR